MAWRIKSRSSASRARYDISIIASALESESNTIVEDKLGPFTGDYSFSHKLFCHGASNNIRSEWFEMLISIYQYNWLFIPSVDEAHAGQLVYQPLNARQLLALVQ